MPKGGEKKEGTVNAQALLSFIFLPMKANGWGERKENLVEKQSDLEKEEGGKGGTSDGLSREMNQGSTKKKKKKGGKKRGRVNVRV